MPVTSKPRRFVFTINNYGDDDLARVRRIECQYIVYSLETGSSGTPHIQGYIIYPTPRTRQQVSRNFPRAYIDIARGTTQQNINYVSKGGIQEIFERGVPIEVEETPSQQGKRTDIEKIKEAVEQGKSYHWIIWNVAKNYQAIQLARALINSVGPKEVPVGESEVPAVVWRWGPSGTGKTRFVSLKHKREDIYQCQLAGLGKTQFVQNYVQQPVVLFDDVRKHNIDLTMFLQMIDKYQTLQLPTKGGDNVVWKPRYIYITSFKNPAEWFEDPAVFAQIKRRATLIDMKKYKILLEDIRGENVESKVVVEYNMLTLQKVTIDRKEKLKKVSCMNMYWKKRQLLEQLMDQSEVLD